MSPAGRKRPESLLRFILRGIGIGAALTVLFFGLVIAYLLSLDGVFE